MVRLKSLDKRLLSDEGGLKTFVTIDGDKTHIEKSQIIGGHLNVNKKMANANGKNIGSDAYNHCASIPAVVVSKWLIEDGLDVYNPAHADRLKAKLNSSDWRYLRTNELEL